jgi:amidase
MEDLSCGRRDFLTLIGASAALGGFVTSDATTAQPRTEPEVEPPTVGDDLCFMTARDLATLIRTKKASAREVMAAHLERIRRVNPKVNAIVGKLDDDKCLALADAADRRAARAGALPPLHGLPIAFKDLQPAVGFRFTRGSPIFKDATADQDALLVERLRKAGVVAIGKTNVPEFGMGSQTYNNVYGTTLNPYDLSKTAGGSSGGAAAALATGMLPIADGSDMGGSLRNPGNFNNIVGMRPTPGLVPTAPTAFPFLSFSVNGPLARTVGDIALLLSAMVGADARDPGCSPSDPAAFRRPLARSFKGTRVAWCPDLGGLPLDPRVRAVLDAQRATFESLGCIVEEAVPDLSGADSIFLTIRGFTNAATYAQLMAEHKDQMKPEAVFAVESGLELSRADVARAMIEHGLLMERIRKFQEKYEFTLCAVNQVPPFDATVHWPQEINGVRMNTYTDWMKSAYFITTTFRPAISVPAGFTSDGLPVGVQIVGRYRDDFGLLQFASAFEQATGFGKKRPLVATAT